MSTNRQAIPLQRYIPPSQRRINVVLVPMETYKENLMGSNELSMKRGESPRSSTYASRHLERRKITTPLEASQKHHRRHKIIFVVGVLLVYSECGCTTSLNTRWIGELFLNGCVHEILERQFLSEMGAAPWYLALKTSAPCSPSFQCDCPCFASLIETNHPWTCQTQIVAHATRL